ncbi:MAG: hypothetical protein AB7G75_27970 [Candidatus Binatia bacterium]
MSIISYLYQTVDRLPVVKTAKIVSFSLCADTVGYDLVVVEGR